jgi:hypothetical protein
MRVITYSHFDLQSIRRPAHLLRLFWRVSWRVAVVLPALFLLVGSTSAQDEEKPKIPGLDKIISANEHLMFTGTVKSLDEKHNILSVNSVEGGDTEIFPIKHSTHVETLDGFRKKLNDVAPGLRVNVYYDQKSDHRMVTRIELFPSESKKKGPHS